MSWVEFSKDLESRSQGGVIITYGRNVCQLPRSFFLFSYLPSWQGPSEIRKLLPLSSRRKLHFSRCSGTWSEMCVLIPVPLTSFTLSGSPFLIHEAVQKFLNHRGARELEISYFKVLTGCLVCGRLLFIKPWFLGSSSPLSSLYFLILGLSLCKWYFSFASWLLVRLCLSGMSQGTWGWEDRMETFSFLCFLCLSVLPQQHSSLPSSHWSQQHR